MKKLFLALLLISASSNLFAEQSTMSKNGLMLYGYKVKMVTASADLTTGSVLIYTTPATGQFFLTGSYGNSVWPNYSITTLSGINIGFIVDMGQPIATPIPVPPNTQLWCTNPDGGNIGISCSIAGFWDPRI